jgi:FtsH ternary system domain X7
MADQKPKFTIRRLDPGEAQTPGHGSSLPVDHTRRLPTPVSSPPPVASPFEPVDQRAGPANVSRRPIPNTNDEEASRRFYQAAVGARFRSSNSTLGFLGLALGMGLTNEAIVRRTPEGHWWAEVAVPSERIAPLIWIGGGVPFVRVGNLWSELAPAGNSRTDTQNLQTAQVEGWPVLELAQLLAQTSLSPRRYRGATALNVIAPGQLGRWIARRATGFNLDVRIIQSTRQAMGVQGGIDQSVSLMRVQSQTTRPISGAFVHSVTNLPYVVVAETFEGDPESIIVDVRNRLPISPAIIGSMVPKGESWVLGPADVGHWRLRRVGHEVDGSFVLEMPLLEASAPPALPPVTQTTTIPVRVIARPDSAFRVDAVLLDDNEIRWLVPFLITQPIAEMSFLLPGPGVHLLTAPGGLSGRIPFGIPLINVGPGALYLELGTTLYPHMPDSARQERFGLDGETAMVVLKNAAYRFDTTQLTPSWVLWVGDAPAVEQGLSAAGKRLLTQVSAAIRQSESEKNVPSLHHKKEISRSQRTKLLERAQKAELAGNLLEAAELLEAAQCPGAAGRLYERAAKPQNYSRRY